MANEKESDLKQLCIRFIKAKRSMISEQRSAAGFNPVDPGLVNESLSEEEVMEIFHNPGIHQDLESRLGELAEELQEVSHRLMPFFKAIRNRSFYIVYDQVRYQFFLNESGEIGFYIPALVSGGTGFN